MRQSELFCQTKKELPKEIQAISYQYLLRGDFVEQTISGVYRFLPLGLRVHRKIEEIIREEMVKLGAQEVNLPVLQNKALWLETGRWNTIDPPLFKLKDRHQKETALGPTHEEEIVDIARKRITSYKDLPVYLFQIQNKFRNEIRPTAGLLRLKEFVMKDLYSFHRDENDLIRFYNAVKRSYFRIFQRCGLKTLCVEANPGTIGGKLSHEFMVLSENGEDSIFICQKCGFGVNLEKVGEIKNCPVCQGKLEKKRAIELGHIFYLGTKYSQAMGAKYRDRDGKERLILMGCYGIGVPRLMAAIVEVHHDEKGIIWPKEIAPFQVHLIRIENSPKVRKTSEKLYRELFSFISQKKSSGKLTLSREKQPFQVLYDDREDKTPGEKFADADLIGIPIRIVISNRTLAKNCLEIKRREEKNPKLLKIKSLNRIF